MARRTAAKRNTKSANSTNGAALGFEATLWATFTHADCGAILSAAASAVGSGQDDSAARRNARNGDR
jgi:hypothetical protein